MKIYFQYYAKYLTLTYYQYIQFYYIIPPFPYVPSFPNEYIEFPTECGDILKQTRHNALHIADCTATGKLFHDTSMPCRPHKELPRPFSFHNEAT